MGKSPFNTKHASTRTIGWSVQGRPLQVRFHENAQASLRAFILAGQHGDEPLAREAALRFLRRASQTNLGRISFALLGDANPDGASVNTRNNAQNRDLNRDHQLLLTPEVQAIHRFVSEWQPHLILDLHTFAPRRKKLLARDLVYHHNVLMDVANNPSALNETFAQSARQFLPDVIGALNEQGHTCDRYVVLSPTRQFRHSVADVLDARNGLALRHQAFTVLLEGRQCKTSAAEGRTVEGLCCAVEEALRWAANHAEQLTHRPLPKAGNVVSLRNRYETSEQSKSMLFLDAAESLVRPIDLTNELMGKVVSTKQAPLPDAYAVPKQAQEVLAILQRHGFVTTSTPVRQAQQYVVEDLITSTTPKRSARTVTTKLRSVTMQAEDYVVFPVKQRGGAALAVLLEPESKYGLCRHPESGLTLVAESGYPILRIPLLSGATDEIN